MYLFCDLNEAPLLTIFSVDFRWKPWSSNKFLIPLSSNLHAATTRPSCSSLCTPTTGPFTNLCTTTTKPPSYPLLWTKPSIKATSTSRTTPITTPFNHPPWFFYASQLWFIPRPSHPLEICRWLRSNDHWWIHKPRPYWFICIWLFWVICLWKHWSIWLWYLIATSIFWYTKWSQFSCNLRFRPPTTNGL